MTSRSEQTLGYVILGLFSIIALFPIVGILLTALQDPDGLATFGTFDGFHFENFKHAWEEGNFGSYLKSSVIVTVVVVVVAGFFSILAGYAFGQMRFRGSTALFYLILLGLMVPMEAIIVPLYYDFRDAGLTNTYWGLILPQIGDLGRVRDVLDARVLPRRAALAGGGRAAGRRVALVHALARAAAAGAPGRADDDRAAVHVDLERVPAGAGDGLRRGPAHGAARAVVLPGPQLVGPDADGRRLGDRRAAGRRSCTSSCSGTSSAGCSPGR